MLTQLTPQDRSEATRLIQEVCAQLGVPEKRGRQVLYWTSHINQEPLNTLETVKKQLARFDELIATFNREISLQQLRRQRPSEEEVLT